MAIPETKNPLVSNVGEILLTSHEPWWNEMGPNRQFVYSRQYFTDSPVVQTCVAPLP